jgi:Tfp pilus assembly protein PilO
MRSLKHTISIYTKLRWALAGATVVAAGLFYGLVYRPQMKQSSLVDASIARTSSELAICQDQTRLLSGVAADVERLRSRLREFKTLPRQQDLAQFIKDISQLNSQANLRKFEQRQGIPVRGTKMSSSPVAMTFEGDFVNVFSFLRHTEELQRLIRVSDLRIESSSGQGAMKDRSGQVKVQMKMNIYFAAE